MIEFMALSAAAVGTLYFALLIVPNRKARRDAYRRNHYNK